MYRIFFTVDRGDNGKINWRDFKQSNLFVTFNLVGNEEDINKIRDFFSYEHFYVIYCKFWELDSDHDFFINEEDFSRFPNELISFIIIY